MLPEQLVLLQKLAATLLVTDEVTAAAITANLFVQRKDFQAVK